MITSKMFEIGPLRPRKSEQFMIHRKNKNKSKDRIPDLCKSLDMKLSDEKKLIRNIHERLNIQNKDKTTRYMSKETTLGFKVLGIPTNIYE